MSKLRTLQFSDDKSLFITMLGLVLAIVGSVYFGPAPLVVITLVAVLYRLIRMYDGSGSEIQKEALLDEIKNTIREAIDKKSELPSEEKEEAKEQSAPDGMPRIKVVGVGGAGGSAINRMIESGVNGVEFIVANTDLQALNSSKAPVRLQLGRNLTRGLGSGSNPDIGRDAAFEDVEKLLDNLEGSDLVIVVAGMGGGTGTGAAPVIASLAIELGALTIAVVTTPFAVEGRKRMAQAETGLSELRGCVDTLITIPNSALREVDEKITLIDAFRRADNAMLSAARGITDLMIVTGNIRLDFADVTTIFRGSGDAFIGTGHGKGEQAAITAMRSALESPLMRGIALKSAKSWLVNIVGSPNMALGEVEDAIGIVEKLANKNADIIWGTIIEDKVQNEISVTLIATRFHQSATIQDIAETSAVIPVNIDTRSQVNRTDLRN